MTEPSCDIEILNQWLNKQEIRVDAITPNPARLMQATLDQEPSFQEGDPLPPLWDWFYFPTMVKRSNLGRDGHPKLGLFLPPVALPRRQWAGGRFTFDQPLTIGENATKTSTIKSIKIKQGRTGQLCFVTVEHKITGQDGSPRSTEEQDIVYREEPKASAPAPDLPEAPDDYHWTEQITPDPVLMFRYSALTFNGHRIHYDRTYSQNTEGYPDLVFHGPLTATLLLQLALKNTKEQKLKSYEFRAVSPLFDTASFAIFGKADGDTVNLWASNLDNKLAMTATARFN